MVEKAAWERLKRDAFARFKANGRLDAQELSDLINCGFDNCHFDEQEKADLIRIISNTTRVDLNDQMWAKVADLIHRFELESDKDAIIAESPEESDL